MTIYLLRHTKPDVPDETFYGHTDIDVVQEDFERNAEKLKKMLPVQQFDAIYSSPLKRCYKLSKEISDHHKIITDRRIMEMNFGDWEMKNWNKIDQNEMQEWMKNFVDAKTPNGESHRILFNRAKDFWDELVNSAHETVCVVTHAGVIRSLLSYILEMPIRKGFSIKLRYNELVRVNHIGENHYNVEFLTCN